VGSRIGAPAQQAHWTASLVPKPTAPLHVPQEFFADAPGEVLTGKSYEGDLERARGCFRHLRTMFQELEECRAFELLKVPQPLPPPCNFCEMLMSPSRIWAALKISAQCSREHCDILAADRVGRHDDRVHIASTMLLCPALQSVSPTLRSLKQQR